MLWELNKPHPILFPSTWNASDLLVQLHVVYTTWVSIIYQLTGCHIDCSRGSVYIQATLILSEPKHKSSGTKEAPENETCKNDEPLWSNGGHSEKTKPRDGCCTLSQASAGELRTDRPKVWKMTAFLAGDSRSSLWRSSLLFMVLTLESRKVAVTVITAPSPITVYTFLYLCINFMFRACSTLPHPIQPSKSFSRPRSGHKCLPQWVPVCSRSSRLRSRLDPS